MTTTTITILDEAARCFVSVRQNLLEGAKLLHQIFNEKSYKDKYDTFEQYVEEECQIKQSFASKLISVHQAWVIERQVSPLKLQGTDVEKLYLGRELEGETEKVLAKVQTLSRDELKAELREEKEPCVTHVPVTFCDKCRMRI